MELGSLSQFIDDSLIFYSQRNSYNVQSNQEPQAKKNRSGRIFSLEQGRELKNNLQRYKQQLQYLIQQNKKTIPKKQKTQQSSSKSNQEKHLFHKIIQPKFLGFFDKSYVNSETTRNQTLTNRHYLLRQMRQNKSEVNKEQINTTTMMKAQKKINEQFEEEQQQTEQEELIEQENRLQRLKFITSRVQEFRLSTPIRQQIQEIRNSQIEKEQLEQLEQMKNKQKEEKTKVVVLKKKKQSNQIKLVQMFPQNKWCKLRNYSLPQKQLEPQQEQTIEYDSTRFIQKIKDCSGRIDALERYEKVIQEIDTNIA